MDTVIIGGSLTGRTIELDKDRIIIGRQIYNLFTINNIPVCYCPEQVHFESVLKELFRVYTKIPWTPGKLCIGGILDGRRSECDRPFIGVQKRDELYPIRPYKESLEFKPHKVHRYVLDRFVINGNTFSFYFLEGLSLSNIIYLLVEKFIRTVK